MAQAETVTRVSAATAAAPHRVSSQRITSVPYPGLTKNNRSGVFDATLRGEYDTDGTVEQWAVPLTK
jgi:hypothetical protein